MASSKRLFALGLALSISGATAGCGGGGSPASGSGGATGAGTGGGSTSTGGTAAGTGGGSASGGASGTGGASATGGAAATGGGPGNSGGATGSGGRGTGGGAGMNGTGGRGTGGAMGGSTGSSGGAAGGNTGSSGGAGGGSSCLTFGAPMQVGTIEDTMLNGPSGMVASRAHPGVLWAHMDTGGPATVFALTPAGKSLGEYALMGVTQTDWEDIAVGQGPGAGSYIYVGDIGDNSANRTQVQIYRLPEPEVTTTQAAVKMTVTAQVLRFTYPDGAHNAETLMVDPVSGDLLILTKDTSGMSTLFKAANATPVDMPTVLEKVTTVQVGMSGTMAAQAGGGDISPTGDRIIVRAYTTTLLWPRAATWAATFMAAPKMLTSPTEPQAEGISFAADGRSWFSTGEQARAIYQMQATCP